MATVSSDANLASITYSLGEQINVTNGAVLTINSTPNIRPGTISCSTKGKIRIVNLTGTPIALLLNAITHDLIATGNGVLEVRGQPIVVHTGTGAAGQSFAAPMDYPTYVEVETALASNLYRPWYVVPNAGTGLNVVAAHAGFCSTGISGNILLFNATTKTLLAGDGVNGNVIPAGCRVRVPNIFINGAASSVSASNRSQIAANAAGTIDLEWVSFGDNFLLQFQNYSSTRLRNVGAIAPVEVLNSSGLFDVQDLSISPDPRSTGSTALSTNNLTGEFYLSRCYSLSGASMGQSHTALTNIALFENVESILTSRSSATNTAIVFQSFSDALLKNITIIGARIAFTNLLRCRADGILYSDRLSGIVDAANAVTLLHLTGLIDSIVRNVGILPGAMPPHNDLLTIDATTSNTVLHSIIIDGLNRSFRLGMISGNKITLARSTFINNRTSGIQANVGDGIVYRDLILNSTTTIAGSSRQQVELVTGSRSAGLANYFEDGPFNILCNTPRTTGNLTIGPFGAAQSRNLYTIVSGGSQVYWDNFGSIFLEGNGNQLIIRNYLSVRAIQSFQNVAPTITGTNTSSLILEYRMTIRGQAMPPTWQSLTGVNLSGAIAQLVGYDFSTGLDMEVRVTASGNDLVRKINLIRLPVNLAGYVPPVGRVWVEVSGCNPGSLVAIFDNTVPANPVVLNIATVGASGIASVEVPCDFSDVVTPIMVRIRKIGYEPLQLFSSYSNSDVKIPISQNQVKDIAGSPIYGRGVGGTASLISFDPMSLRVDIGNGRVVGEDFYDAIALYQASEVGIRYPEILRFNGTDGLLLNGWKLRRLNSGAVNAGVDISVSIDGSPGVSPDDELNGSVDITPRTVRQINASSLLSGLDIVQIAEAVRQEMDANSSSLGILKRRTAAML
jgi:hypothetical protein